MTTDDVVVDVSQDWVLACDVQQRFMQGLGNSMDDFSKGCQTDDATLAVLRVL